MRNPSTQFRIYFLMGVVFLGMGAIFAKLWYVQIARGAEYTARLKSGSQVTVRIPAVRGEILDRNGIPLVQNRASFDVDFYLPDMVRAYREEVGSVPMVEYRGTVHNMPRTMKEADVVTIVREAIIPRLEDLGVAENYNSSRLQIHYRNNREVPFNYRQDLDFESMAILSERSLELPGVIVTKKPVRNYVYGAFAAHVLGYVGAPKDIRSQPDVGQFNFYDPDMEGRAQVELAMDEYLRGRPGVRVLQRNVKGVIEGEVSVTEPVQGANVYLTLDARIQAIAEKAMRSVGRGAVVVMNPNNGDVLAMVSVPSFDPNRFIPAISSKDWEELMSDQTVPLLNRAITGFEPGSTFKIVTALGVLLGGKGNAVYECAGGVTYGNTFMRCTSVHGRENLEDAIKHSCNSYFYLAANSAGIQNLVKAGQLLGLGQRSGIPLSGEDTGILPGPEYLARVRPRERWTSGYTANTAIGQGEVLATPLQMAMVAATVANGGVCYYPRLVDRAVEQDGTVAYQEPVRVKSVLTRDAALKDADVERVRRGMWKVVNEGGGTGLRARISGVEVAGKTGTAQNWAIRGGRKVRDNHVWFIAFAPYEKPRYALAVIVQGGKSGGGVAAPIAGEILERIFRLESQGDGGSDTVYQLAKFEPARGNFDFVESVDFKRAIPAAYAQVEIDEGRLAPPTNRTVVAASAAAAVPNVRAEADERGRVRNKVRQPTGLQKLFNFFGGGNRRDKKRDQSALRQ